MIFQFNFKISILQWEKNKIIKNLKQNLFHILHKFKNKENKENKKNKKTVSITIFQEKLTFLLIFKI